MKILDLKEICDYYILQQSKDSGFEAYMFFIYWFYYHTYNIKFIFINLFLVTDLNSRPLNRIDFLHKKCL